MYIIELQRKRIESGQTELEKNTQSNDFSSRILQQEDLWLSLVSSEDSK